MALDPVKLVESDKNRRLSNLLWQEMSKLLQFIIAPDVYFSPFHMFMMPLETYLKAYKKKSIMLKVHAEMRQERNFYLFFEYDAAIVLGAYMRMNTESVIHEKLAKQNFDEGDRDAFGEVGNQLVGCLDRLLREFAIENIHLTLDFKRNVYPDEEILISSFENDKEYIVLLSELKVPGFPKTKVTILVPQALFETIIGQPVELQGVKPKFVVFSSFDQSTIDQVSEGLRSRFTRVRSSVAADDAIHLIKEGGVCCAGFELAGIEAPLAQQNKILLKRIFNIRGIDNIPLFFSMKDPSPAKVKELRDAGCKTISMDPASKVFEKWALNFTDDPK